MPRSKMRSMLLYAAVGAGVFVAAAAVPAQATRFAITNLVSDGFVPAVTIDPDLVNPWGMSYAPTGPFWVSDNATGVSTLYNGAGAKLGLTVAVAPPVGGSPPPRRPGKFSTVRQPVS